MRAAAHRPVNRNRWQTRGPHLASRSGRRIRAFGFERASKERRASDIDALCSLARAVGIQTSYIDAAGHRRQTSPETLREILRLWGIDVRNAKTVRNALQEEQEHHWRQVIPPVALSWDGKPSVVPLHLPVTATTGRAFCRLHFEDGRCQSLDWDPRRLRRAAAAQSNSKSYVALQFPLPGLPFGYHTLEIELGDRRHESLLISAPTRSYAPEETLRGWGSFLPLYALHSESSWGAGNFTDLARLADWTASQGGSAVGTLPLLAGFLDPPFSEPSPYSPASRLFWNEFYLDITNLPEFARCKAAQKLVQSSAFRAQLKSFRDAPLIDYTSQAAARRQVLEVLAEFFFAKLPSQPLEFHDFLLRRPAARDYAEFRAACEQSGTSWQMWEGRMRYGRLQPGDYRQSAKNYHLYVQWAAEQQLAALVESCQRKGVQIYLDTPVGVDRGGYDVWRQSDIFAAAASVGAPPDLFFPKGQNWGFPPLQPSRLRRRGYQYFIDCLRFQMRHAGFLRIDHILGLHRLYWIPPGAPASMGAYVSYPAEEFQAILSLESHRHQTVIAGENLGTVPREVNEAMKRHQFRETYVLQYQLQPRPKSAVRPPPVFSVASLNTHDMPPFAAHWRRLDITRRCQLKLFPEQKAAQEARRRHALNSALVQFLKRKRLLKDSDPEVRTVLRACLEWLARTPAQLVLINLEDLWEEQEWQNVPGTLTEHPNWRRKARLSLEQLAQNSEIAEFVLRLSRSRPSSA